MGGYQARSDVTMHAPVKKRKKPETQQKKEREKKKTLPGRMRSGRVWYTGRDKGARDRKAGSWGGRKDKKFPASDSGLTPTGPMGSRLILPTLGPVPFRLDLHVTRPPLLFVPFNHEAGEKNTYLLSLSISCVEPRHLSLSQVPTFLVSPTINPSGPPSSPSRPRFPTPLLPGAMDGMALNKALSGIFGSISLTSWICLLVRLVGGACERGLGRLPAVTDL